MKHLAAVVGIVAALACLGGVFTASAGAHAGNPDYRSVIDSITPPGLADGIRAEVVNYDDHVVLENRSGREVVVLGEENEPYVRFLADGTVQVNLNSPSHYRNQDRYARVAIPARADRDAAPAWKTVGNDGRYEWHDHRSHFMSESIPPQVKDESKRTKIKTYEIPLRVDGRPARINGTLYWHGRDDEVRWQLFVLLGLVVIAGTALVLTRRRRRRDGDSGPDPQA